MTSIIQKNCTNQMLPLNMQLTQMFLTQCMNVVPAKADIQPAKPKPLQERKPTRRAWQPPINAQLRVSGGPWCHLEQGALKNFKEGPSNGEGGAPSNGEGVGPWCSITLGFNYSWALVPK